MSSDLLKEDIMRKRKLFLLMACMVMALSACQGKDAKQETDSTPVVEENREEKDVVEKSDKAEINNGVAFEGLTLEELENLGFEIGGCGYSSVFGANCISLSASKNNYLYLSFKIAEVTKEEFEEISDECKAADDQTEYFYNYLKENHPDNTISNCTVSYQIGDQDTLLQACADGVCEEYADIENRTMEELYGEGYEFDTKQGSAFGTEDDMQYNYYVFLKKNGEDYIIILDEGGNQALGELDFSADDEEEAEAINSAIVIEAYQLHAN